MTPTYYFKKRISITLLLFIYLIISCKTSETAVLEIDKIKSAGSFAISEDLKAITLNGEITSSSFVNFKKIATAYQNAQQINIINCNGSNDDEVNLMLSKYIHDNKYNVHLNNNGTIASGGTDLFVAGIKRTKGSNTKIGVHSWSDSNGTEATSYPRVIMNICFT